MDLSKMQSILSQEQVQLIRQYGDGLYNLVCSYNRSDNELGYQQLRGLCRLSHKEAVYAMYAMPYILDKVVGRITESYDNDKAHKELSEYYFEHVVPQRKRDEEAIAKGEIFEPLFTFHAPSYTLYEFSKLHKPWSTISGGTNDPDDDTIVSLRLFDRSLNILSQIWYQELMLIDYESSTIDKMNVSIQRNGSFNIHVSRETDGNIITYSFNERFDGKLHAAFFSNTYVCYTLQYIQHVLPELLAGTEGIYHYKEEQ